jgi:hypothetical protein
MSLGRWFRSTLTDTLVGAHSCMYSMKLVLSKSCITLGASSPPRGNSGGYRCCGQQMYQALGLYVPSRESPGMLRQPTVVC